MNRRAFLALVPALAAVRLDKLKPATTTFTTPPMTFTLVRPTPRWIYMTMDGKIVRLTNCKTLAEASAEVLKYIEKHGQQ